MPEGAEVKLTGEGLAHVVSGKTLTNIEAISGRYVKKPIAGLDEMLTRLPSQVVGIGVHGKFLYWIVANDVFIFNTLGMTGHWTTDRQKHSRVRFDFGDGTKVYYTDMRNFGTLKMVPGRDKLVKKLKSLGPDMLSGDVSDELFIERLRAKSGWNITKALMNQSVVAGIGNYVKAETLYMAGISPHREIDDLSDDELATLNTCAQQVLSAAYDNRGATIRNYRDPDGNKGQYNRRFAVYNQTNCPQGHPVVKEKTPDGRTTHWVPNVQK